MKIKFTVEGMSCAACSASVEKVSGRIDGVNKAEVNLIAKTLFVECDHDTPELRDKICAAVERAGFSATPIEDKPIKNNNTKAPEKRDDGEKAMKKRLFFSIILLIVLMYITMGQMVGLPVPSFLNGTENLIIFAFTQFLLTLPIVYLNRKYYFVGFKALWNRSPNMDTLVAVGSSAALIYGVFAIYMIGYGLGHGDSALAELYGHNLYFESAAMILTLVTVGKYLEERSKGETGAAVDRLLKLAPDLAEIERDGRLLKVKASELAVGDVVIIRPGQSIPADGVIVEGFSSIDESALTGESIPVEKTVGSEVLAASINRNGSFKFRAERVGSDTALAKIISLVQDAGATKAPIAKLADKVSGIFVPIVMIISLISFVFWMLMGKSLDFSLSIGISVLVISCPCALGLATPVAVTVAIGKLAEHGILVKSAESLEILHKTKCVVLDKTGTITEGKPTVTDVIVNSQSSDEDELLLTAVTLEISSEHPLAEAIKDYCKNRGITAASVDAFKAIPGLGVEGIIDGSFCIGGNYKFLLKSNIDIHDLSETLESITKQGKTPMLFAKDGKYIGMIAVADKVKESSPAAVKKMSDMGVSVTMLTGDNRLTADAIASNVGIETVFAEVLPQDKDAIVSKMQADGSIVLFAGDGINDSPALTRADIGMAIGSGADIAIDSADIVLMHSELDDIPTAIDFSNKTMRIIKQNLFWAFFYNSLGIPIAAGLLVPFGITLSPMLGAAAMSLSSLFVVTNALRLHRK